MTQQITQLCKLYVQNQLYYDKLSKANATQIAIANNHLDGIRYIYSSQKSYLSFYDQYNNTEALKIAEQLKDVRGIEYIYMLLNFDSMFWGSLQYICIFLLPFLHYVCYYAFFFYLFL
jgi:hypothetical protein